MNAPVLELAALDLALGQFLQAQMPSADARHPLLASLVSYQYRRGHACLDLDQLARNAVATLGLLDPPSQDWGARLRDAATSLPWTVGPTSPLVLQGHRLYLRRNWAAEHTIRTALLARLQAACAVPERLEHWLDQLFGACAAGGPDWQKIACALAMRSHLTLITGGPGTGKTSTVVRVLALLQMQAASLGRPAWRVALAAPTGKAAARLTQAISLAAEALPAPLRLDPLPAATTLHKLLALRASDADTGGQRLGVEVLVVDEASMVDLEMMASLLRALPVSARVVMLGDRDQLASVQAGAVWAQLCHAADGAHYDAGTVAWLQRVAHELVPSSAEPADALAQQTVVLRRSWRFRDDGGIGAWARAVNAGDVAAVADLWRATPDYANHAHVEVDRLSGSHAHDPRLHALIRNGLGPWWARVQACTIACSDAQVLALLDAMSAFQVLCAVREGAWGVLALNAQIAQILECPAQAWFHGRAVMVTRNDYGLALMNGDVGLCLARAQGLRVAFADGSGGVRWVLPSRLDAVEDVFAMTVHKSQGSEFSHVCLVLPGAEGAVLTRELLYTGLTRAKSRLSLVIADETGLLRAVRARVLRSGGLVGWG